jgi:photosystem II stability/assembly factor-like uncharacterized protein
VVSPVLEGRLFAGGQDGSGVGVVLRSNDYGDTWTWLFPTPNREDAVFSLELDPQDPDVVWAGTNGTVKQSRDGGVSWNLVLLPANPAFVTGLLLLGDTLYAAADEEVFANESSPPSYPLGLYRSGDRGATWDTLAVPSTALGALDLVADTRGRLLIATRSGVWRFDR